MSGQRTNTIARRRLSKRSRYVDDAEPCLRDGIQTYPRPPTRFQSLVGLPGCPTVVHRLQIDTDYPLHIVNIDFCPTRS